MSNIESGNLPMPSGRPDQGPKLAVFVSAARGTEVVLRDELRTLKFKGIRADRGGVHVEATMRDVARLCLCTRIGVRVFIRLGEFDAGSEQALYDGVRNIDLSHILPVKKTLAVSAVVRDSYLTHSHYIALKTKDAVVDRIRDREGARPSVDAADPDVAIFVHLLRDRATVYLDASGTSLHLRGYRTRIGDAPLKETLAATCIYLADWDRQSPFMDPMCGSGTIAIEAAMIAHDIAPGLFRKRFGFERWASHDASEAAMVAKMREDFASYRLGPNDAPEVHARDIDRGMLEIAELNAKTVNVPIRFRLGRIGELERVRDRGVVVTNPPYGERLLAPRALFDEMAEGLRKLVGWDVGILSGTPEIEESMRIPPDLSHPLWNGPLECRLLGYRIR